MSYIAELFCSTSETNTLYINYTSIKNSTNIIWANAMYLTVQVCFEGHSCGNTDTQGVSLLDSKFPDGRESTVS